MVISEVNGDVYVVSITGDAGNGMKDVDDIIKPFFPKGTGYNFNLDMYTIPEGEFEPMLRTFLEFADKCRRFGVEYNLEKYSTVRSAKGEWHTFEGCVHYMDDDLREKICRDYNATTDQEFFSIYARLHKEKFGEDFAPWVDGEW